MAMAANIPMIAITIINSINVKPFCPSFLRNAFNIIFSQHKTGLRLTEDDVSLKKGWCKNKPAFFR
jgi:hypothetical protein